MRLHSSEKRTRPRCGRVRSEADVRFCGARGASSSSSDEVASEVTNSIRPNSELLRDLKMTIPLPALVVRPGCSRVPVRRCVRGRGRGAGRGSGLRRVGGQGGSDCSCRGGHSRGVVGARAATARGVRLYTTAGGAITAALRSGATGADWMARARQIGKGLAANCASRVVEGDARQAAIGTGRVLVGQVFQLESRRWCSWCAPSGYHRFADGLVPEICGGFALRSHGASADSGGRGSDMAQAAMDVSAMRMQPFSATKGFRNGRQ